MNNQDTFYTIGHATRQMDEFVFLLKSQNISLLVDVRSVPRSRTNPDYNEDKLQEFLHPYDIEYIRIPELGGFRAKSKVIPPETNGYWTHNSFHSYADYAMGEEFDAGLKRLLMLGATRPSAIMCAEMLWWRCHRRIIADYLLSKGKKVYHIINETNIKPARLTPSALILLTGAISYPEANRTTSAVKPTQHLQPRL
ncbi:MAG: DUF488 domain-containing protein [Clostridia bacterium]